MSDPKLDLTTALNRLSVHKEFSFFLAQVKQLREEAIADMFNAGSDKLQQISGQILAYDQMLKMTNAEHLIVWHSTKE
jgi:hypothetical protein